MLTGKLVLTNELKKLIDHRKEWSVVDVKPRNQITCNSLFEREINNSSKALSEEIIITQVQGERVLSENRLERKRQSNQRKLEVKGVKRVEKSAQES